MKTDAFEATLAKTCKSFRNQGSTDVIRFGVLKLRRVLPLCECLNQENKMDLQIF